MRSLLAIVIVVCPLCVPSVRADNGSFLLAKRTGWIELHAVGGLSADGATPTYVITHGLGGNAPRFWGLAHALKAKHPQANVLVADWSANATKGAKGPNGLASPWAVSPLIQPTGDALANLLEELADLGVFHPEQAIFIGESFGCYVNHRAGERLYQKGFAKAACILAFNPAHELGGYQPPDLAASFQFSVSFHSTSPFDTQKEIAHVAVELPTPSADPFAQHTYGVTWFTMQVEA